MDFTIGLWMPSRDFFCVKIKMVAYIIAIMFISRVIHKVCWNLHVVTWEEISSNLWNYKGAAKAHLFGAYYAQVYPQRSIHLVSVASPRVGNYAFKIFSESLENLRIWRIVNCRDLVPRLPNFQYYHAGNFICRHCRNQNYDRFTDIMLNRTSNMAALR